MKYISNTNNLQKLVCLITWYYSTWQILLKFVSFGDIQWWFYHNIWIFLKNFLQQPPLSVLSMLTSMFFALISWHCPARMMIKMLFSVKISLIYLLIASMGAPLNGFLSVMMSWSVFIPTRLSCLARYS